MSTLFAETPTISSYVNSTARRRARPGRSRRPHRHHTCRRLLSKPREGSGAGRQQGPGRARRGGERPGTGEEGRRAARDGRGGAASGLKVNALCFIGQLIWEPLGRLKFLSSIVCDTPSALGAGILGPLFLSVEGLSEIVFSQGQHVSR